MPDISLTFTNDRPPVKSVATMLQPKLPPELPGLKAWRISGGDKSTDPDWATDGHLMVRSDLPGAQQLRFVKAEEGRWLVSRSRLITAVERADGATHAVVSRFAGLADAMALAEERGMDVYDTGADIFLRREDDAK